MTRSVPSHFDCNRSSSGQTPAGCDSNSPMSGSSDMPVGGAPNGAADGPHISLAKAKSSAARSLPVSIPETKAGDCKPSLKVCDDWVSPVAADRHLDGNEAEVETSGLGVLGLSGQHTAQRLRKAALLQAGDFTLAYNTAVQEGLEYFWGDQRAAGYIAYSRRKGNIFVLGDPVVSPSDLSELTKQFVSQFPHATFCQVSSSTARVLQECGYYVNEMGVDTTLHLPEYSFGGKTMERIRYASNWLKRRGFEIFEADYSQVRASEIEQVSQQWRSNRNVKKREMRFLNRPIRFEDEPDVRKFFLRDADGRIMAFFYFDPLYRDGQVIGYATSIKRRHPDAPLYTEQGIMRYAVQKFKDEGKLEVKLGLSPLAFIENKNFRANPLLHFSFRYGFSAWWVNKYFYNLKGHAAYKRHFKGEESPMHYASPVLINDVRIASMLRLTGVY